MANIANPDIRKSASSPTREYEEYIARALATEGGHLSIGRGVRVPVDHEHGFRLIVNSQSS